MHIENGLTWYGIVLKVLNELNEFFKNWMTEIAKDFTYIIEMELFNRFYKMLGSFISSFFIPFLTV